MPDLTPAQVADADQRHAGLGEAVAVLADAVRPTVTSHGELAATAELYEQLAESDWPREGLAALAALAIVRNTQPLEGTTTCP